MFHTQQRNAGSAPENTGRGLGDQAKFQRSTARVHLSTILSELAMRMNAGVSFSPDCSYYCHYQSVYYVIGNT